MADADNRSGHPDSTFVSLKIFAVASVLVIAALLCAPRAEAEAFVQQGPKIQGTGVVGSYGGGQGYSVSLSADGNTAIVGGPQDNLYAGAVWVFTRGNGVWTQQGDKLVPNDVAGAPGVGRAIAVSADGNTALVGGPYDNSQAG